MRVLKYMIAVQGAIIERELSRKSSEYMKDRAFITIADKVIGKEPNFVKEVTNLLHNYEISHQNEETKSVLSTDINSNDMVQKFLYEKMLEDKEILEKDMQKLDYEDKSRYKVVLKFIELFLNMESTINLYNNDIYGAKRSGVRALNIFSYYDRLALGKEYTNKLENIYNRMKNEIDDDRSKSIELLIDNYRKLETFFKNAPEKIKIFNEEDSSSTSVDNHKNSSFEENQNKKDSFMEAKKQFDEILVLKDEINGNQKILDKISVLNERIINMFESLGFIIILVDIFKSIDSIRRIVKENIFVNSFDDNSCTMYLTINDNTILGRLLLLYTTTVFESGSDHSIANFKYYQMMQKPKNLSQEGKSRHEALKHMISHHIKHLQNDREIRVPNRIPQSLQAFSYSRKRRNSKQFMLSDSSQDE